jgi:hypothetical protein
MKDYYDILVLSLAFAFEGEILCERWPRHSNAV